MKLSTLNRSQGHAIKSLALTLILSIGLWHSPLENQFIALKNLSSSVNGFKQAFFSPKKPSRQVIVVGIDDAALKEFGRWPWDRALQGKLLGKLGDAGLVALDILYIEESPGDAMLAEHVAALPRVVGSLASLPNSSHASKDMLAAMRPYMITDIRHKESSSEDERYLLMPELHQLSQVPSQLLPHLERSGLVHINHTGTSKQLNYMPGMIDDQQGLVVPSLGLQILQTWFDSKFTIESGLTNRIYFSASSPQFVLRDYSGIPLNYYQSPFPMVSAEALLNDEIDPGLFKEKIVVVGFTATGLHDTFVTPLGPMKGVELHTTLVSNFLNDEIIKQSPGLFNLLYLLLAIAAWSITLLRPHSYTDRFALMSAGIALIFSLDFAFFVLFDLWINSFGLFLAFFILASCNEILWSIDQEYSSGHLKRAFQTYLSEELLQMIRQNPEQISLGGQLQEASFLFSDIRNFSRLSEDLNAEELVTTLNQYFTPMTKSVLEHNGMLDKYIGDSIMAIFNAPVPIPDHPLEACLCALDMSEKTKRLNVEQKAKGFPELEIGIGINTGEAIIGNMGSDVRFSYTAMGDAVNIASRLEGITKIYKCEILVGEQTWDQVRAHLSTRYIDTVILKGKEEASPIFQIMAKTDQNRKMCQDFNEARSLYSRAKFKEARKAFLACEEKWSDPSSLVFAERALHYIENGTPENWKDTYKLSEK